jgi:hypothetical protein
MARVQVTQRSGKTAVDLDRVPVTGDFVAVGKREFVKVVEVCLFPAGAPFDAVAIAQQAGDALSADMMGAVELLED